MSATENPDEYSAIIPNLEGEGYILYYIEATDGRNFASLPENISNPFNITILSNETNDQIDDNDDEDFLERIFRVLPLILIIIVLITSIIIVLIFYKKRRKHED
jgi:hypothetical protein